MIITNIWISIRCVIWFLHVHTNQHLLFVGWRRHIQTRWRRRRGFLIHFHHGQRCLVRRHRTHRIAVHVRFAKAYFSFVGCQYMRMPQRELSVARTCCIVPSLRLSDQRQAWATSAAEFSIFFACDIRCFCESAGNSIIGLAEYMRVHAAVIGIIDTDGSASGSWPGLCVIEAGANWMYRVRAVSDHTLSGSLLCVSQIEFNFTAMFNSRDIWKCPTFMLYSSILLLYIVFNLCALYSSHPFLGVSSDSYFFAQWLGWTQWKFTHPNSLLTLGLITCDGVAIPWETFGKQETLTTSI